MITSYAWIFLFKMPSFLPVILNNDFFPIEKISLQQMMTQEKI